MPAGRPTKYTPDLAAAICELISGGSNLDVITDNPNVPSRVTVYAWLDKYPEFLNNYLKARTIRADVRADRIDNYCRRLLAGELEPAAAAIVIRTEMWQAGRENPKRYGDKQAIEHSGDVRISHYQAHDQAIIDRYNARKLNGMTVEHKPNGNGAAR